MAVFKTHNLEGCIQDPHLEAYRSQGELPQNKSDTMEGHLCDEKSPFILPSMSLLRFSTYSPLMPSDEKPTLGFRTFYRFSGLKLKFQS